MMKKISAIVLTLIFLISMFVPVTVGAEFSEENISVTVNAFNIDVAVTSDTEGTVIAHLTNEAGDRTYGLDYDETPDETDGVYTYTFNFEMEKTAPTQKLYLRVGDAVPTTKKLVNFANINDKNNFYNRLYAVTDVSLVDEYLYANKSYKGVDVETYLGLSESIRTLVSAIILDLDLDTGYENLETETDEYISAKVSAVTEVETLFNSEFAQAMKCAKIADSNETEWLAISAATMKSGLFDDEYFVANGGIPALLSVDDVYSYFVEEVKAITELKESELKKAFDRATLMAIEEKLEYNTVGLAFLYFEEKGTMAVSDRTDISTLIANGKESDFWKNVKAGTYTNCSDLLGKMVEIASSMTVDNTPDGGVTGGNVTTPSSPGGFTGGGMGGSGGGASAPATKPEEPKIETSAGTFSDIASVEWAKESIEALAEKGVLNGKGDGKFAPNDSVTREEFVKIIIGAFDLLNADAKADFGDVDSNRWSYAFIATANELGIVSGDGASFNPTGAMSRQDMAVVICRTAEKLGLELSGDAEDFDDSEEFADYAKDSIKALTASGIVNGMGDGTFSPKLTVTRAQAAKVIYGLMNLVGGGK